MPRARSARHIWERRPSPATREHAAAEQPSPLTPTRRAAPLARLAPGIVQRAGGEVDAGGVQAQARSHEGVLARTAADVEHPAPDEACAGEVEERGLGPAISQ